MTDAIATYGTVGSTFQINAYIQIAFTYGVDGSVIAGDRTVNETPNDRTQTYGGNAIAWDYTIQVSDGTNTYQIALLDYDINGNGSMQYPGAEQGYFLAFIGSVPPFGTRLTQNSILNNSVSILVSSLIPCLVAGTSINTPSGPRAVETLQEGHAVLTADSGPQRLHLVGMPTVGLLDMVIKPKLQPIRIAAGAMGAGLPLRNLCVSPQHACSCARPSPRGCLKPMRCGCLPAIWSGIRVFRWIPFRSL